MSSLYGKQAKSMLLTVVISAPVLGCVLKIIELGGRHFYVYVWGFMFVFSIIMLTIAPCLLYTSPSPRDKRQPRMPSSA